jgi:hypothetical protein
MEDAAMRLLPSFASPFVFVALFFGLLTTSPALASGPVIGWGGDNWRYWGPSTPVSVKYPELPAIAYIF